MGYRYNPATGKLSKESGQAKSSPEILPTGIKPGQQVSMIDPSGQAFIVPAEQVRDAIEQGGYQIENAQARQQRIDEEDFGDQDLRTFAESGASAFTFGISDLVLSKFDKEGLAARRRVNDDAALAGEIVGSTAALLVPGTGVAKAAQAAERIGATAAKSLGAEVAQRAAGLATRGAFEGAAMGVQQAVSEKALGNPEQFGELLYSKIGMNALAGAIGNPVLDLGFAGLGKVAAKAGDAAQPFIPGAYQAIDPLTHEPLEGAKAAIARRINDVTATVAQMNPFNKAPKDVLELTLNNPEGRRLLKDPDVWKELTDFTRMAPEMLKDFKKSGLAANHEVRKGLDEVIELTKQGRKADEVEIAKKIFNVHEAVHKAQRVAQEALDKEINSLTGKPRGLLEEFDKRMLKTSRALERIPGAGSMYKNELDNAFQEIVMTYAEKGPITEGAEIALLRKLKQRIGNKAQWQTQLERLTPQDREAVMHYRNLSGYLNDTLKDPKKVGDYAASLIAQADSEYTRFKGMQGVFRNMTQLRTETGTGKGFVNRLDKTVKKLNNAEDNMRMQSVLDNVADIDASAGTLATELQTLLETSSVPKELQTEIRTFLKSPAAKDPELLREFAENLGSNKGLKELTEFSTIQKRLESVGDEKMRFERAVELQRARGEITDEQAKKLLANKKMARAYGNWESPTTGQQGSLGTLQAVTAIGAGMAAGPMGVAGVIGALPVTNTLAYTRLLDGIVKAGDLQRNELVSSVVGAIKSLGRKGLEQTIRIKSVPKMSYEEMTKEVEKSRDTMQGIQENPMFTYMPDEVIAPVMNTHMRATQFLDSKLPRPPRQSPSMFNIQKNWKPTDGEKKRFEKYFDAVKNPVSVVKDLADGQVSREQVEALKSVYPQMYEQIGLAISSVMNDEDFLNKVPYEKRLQMSIFFETAADVSMQPEYILNQQLTYQAQEKQGQPTQGGLNKLKSVAKNEMSEMQRLQS